MSNPTDPPFAFIIGCPRSGTTLLRAMLDSHPLVAVPPESYFTVKALRRAERYTRPDGLDRAALLRDIAGDISWPSWAIDADRLAPIAEDSSLATVPAVLREVYAEYARGAGKVRAIDKTPQHTEHVPLLDAGFTGCRFVHLVRDGRDVVPSLRSMPYFPTGFAEAALFWRDRVLSGRDARRVVGRGRYLELRYEDLVADPERHLPEVCAFLDLEYDPRMLEYPERAESVIAGTVGETHHGNLRRAPAPTRDWRRELSAREVERFEALAGDALGMFGYERGPAPAMALRAEALGRHGAATVGHGARIVRARIRRLLPGRPSAARPGPSGSNHPPRS